MSIWKKSSPTSASTNRGIKRAWRPNRDSFHYKIYQKWKLRKGYLNYHENDFYRYWRIICLWSPIEAVKPLLIAFMAIACLLGTTGLVVLAIVELVASNGVLLTAIVFLSLYCLLGLIALCVYLWSPYSIAWGSKTHYALLPAMIATGTFVFAGKYLAILLTWLYRQMMGSPMGNCLRRLCSKPWLSWWQLIWLLPLTLLIVGFWHPAAWAYLFSIALIISVPGAVLLFTYLGEKSKKLQTVQLDLAVANYQRAQMDVFLRNLYAIQHPKYAHDDKRFKEWLKRYKKWFYAYVKYDKSAWFVLDRHLKISKKLRQKYQQLHGATEGQINSLPATAEFLTSQRSSPGYGRILARLFNHDGRDKR